MVEARSSERKTSDAKTFRPGSTDRTLAAERAWPLLIVALGGVTALLFFYPLSHIATSLSFNYSEGWNTYWADAARTGHALYESGPNRTITNYPPISFHLVAFLSQLTGGDVTRAGRLLGVFCLFWSAANVGVATQRVTSSTSAGWLAALSLLLWMSLITSGRIGTNDPHFLALALSTLGLAALLRSEDREGWVCAAAAAFATALFVKNAMLGFPVAAVIWLIFGRHWRALAIFLATGAAVSAAWYSLVVTVDGPFFLAHLLSPRLFDRTNGIAESFGFLGVVYAPVLISIAGVSSRQNARLYFPGLCLVCALAVDIALAFGNGVVNNIFFETIAALAIVSVASIDIARRVFARSPHGSIVVVITTFIALGSVLTWAPTELYAAVGRRERLARRVNDYAAGVEIIRNTQGPALCESLLMCFQAGKPFVFDPYYVKDQIAVGRLSEAQITDDFSNRRFGVVEIGEDDPSFQLVEGERLRFTAATMRVLLANYQVAFRATNFAVLVPR